MKSGTSTALGSGERSRSRSCASAFGTRNCRQRDHVKSQSKYEIIKLLSLLARPDGLSHEQFLQMWTATRTSALVVESHLCRRYVQYRLHPDRVWPPGTPQLDLRLDGIEEIWLEGYPEKAEEALNSVKTPPYLDNLKRYSGAIATFVFEEKRITNALPDDAAGTGLLKRLVPLVRKNGWSHEQFIRHWVNIHAELLKDVEPSLRRYCQLYVNAEIPPPDGVSSLGVHIDGFSESWFVDEAEMNAGGETPAGKALAADNRIYLERSKRFFFDEVEYPVANRSS